MSVRHEVQVQSDALVQKRTCLQNAPSPTTYRDWQEMGNYYFGGGFIETAASFQERKMNKDDLPYVFSVVFCVFVAFSVA